MKTNKKESTKVSDIFTEDINKLTEHLNIVIEAHNKQLDEIKRLISNWNELEKYLQGRYKEWIGSKNEITRESACEDYLILDFMKYLKENNK